MPSTHNDIQKINSELVASLPLDKIQSRIYTIRGVQVMLDRDLAVLYEVETKVLNQAVKRNVERFPKHFMFQLTEKEWQDWKSQFVTANYMSQEEIAAVKMGIRRPPYVFTEQGVSQLSAVLRSKVAIAMSIRIIDAFVAMRHYLTANAGILQRLDNVEVHQLQTSTQLDEWKIETNKRFDDILKRLDDGSLKAKIGVFFDGQMFDAFTLVEDMVKRCKHRICLIDDYVDADVLQRFRQRDLTATVDCYVNQRHITSAMQQAFAQYNAQYPTEHVELHTFNKSHDRWLIIDNTVYHFGASIKDLGKKWFAVDIVTEHTADELIARITT